MCDSVLLVGLTCDDYFSLSLVFNILVIQYYSGDLMCFPDLGTLVLINISDVEKYVSGVVMADGGSGKNIEYFKKCYELNFSPYKALLFLNDALMETI